MPNDAKTVAAYAAGASLAAIAAFYVFGPTFFIDGDHAYATNDGRKRTIVGLVNNANDCFINSVLQALAGLGDVRLYLIKELHRREIEGKEIYAVPPPVLRKGDTADKVVNLQSGLVTRALKEMLDALNERPIYKKTISARPLISALEKAFRTRISRNQQDAHEFLQIVLERLCDEYHAAENARKRATEKALPGRADESGGDGDGDGDGDDDKTTHASSGRRVKTEAAVASSQGFPFEGRIESQIQCQHCGFKTKPSATTFVSLTLNVPQKSATSLDSCFDMLLKSEEIDDFKCDKCRLRQALEWKQSLLRSAKTDTAREQLERDIGKIDEAIRTDPEKPPEGVELPDRSQAPKRKIRKSTRITVFPKVIAIHLSRSVFDPGSYSIKNLAKVSYTQRLRLGGLLNEKWYKLLGVVCHKGSHSSGHYESFRRNHLYPPFATPDTFAAYAAACRPAAAMSSTTPNSAGSLTTTRTTTTATTPTTPTTTAAASTAPTVSAAPSLSSSTEAVAISDQTATTTPVSCTPESTFSVGPPSQSQPLSTATTNTTIINTNPNSATNTTASLSLPSSALPAPSSPPPSPSPSPSHLIRRTDTTATTATTATSIPQITMHTSPNASRTDVRFGTTTAAAAAAAAVAAATGVTRRKKASDRWWRISDDKIKEARTSDVLSMQREVYLLFYELEREGEEGFF